MLERPCSSSAEHPSLSLLDLESPSATAIAAAATGRDVLSDVLLDLICWSLSRMLTRSGAGLRQVAVLLERGGVGTRRQLGFGR